jgi:phosphoglycolate phosphatase
MHRSDVVNFCMRREFKAVIFDFDYTLADSAKGIFDCFNFALESMGLPTAPERAVCATIGMSLPAAFRDLTGDARQENASVFSNLFIRRAAEVMVDKTIVFESVGPAVKALRAQGLFIGIFSTKYRYRIEQILNREKLFSCFDVIVGGEDVAVHKPDPGGLFAAIQSLGSTPSETLYVGDSLTDAETAKAAGVPFIAVLSGVTSKEAFDSCEVYMIIDSLLQLPDILRGPGLPHPGL